MILLLIFFALPIATILLSIVLQRILRCPILVAITFFAIFLVVAFVLDILGILDLGTALIATLIYTFLAFITAFIVCLLSRNDNSLIRNCLCCNNDDNSNNNSNNISDEDNGSNCGCNRSIDIVELNNNNNLNYNTQRNVGRCNFRRF